MSEPRRIAGALLVYRRPVSSHFRDAATIDEHIAAFARHSAYPVYEWNTELGYPRGLEGVRFDAVVMHYSLFGHGGDAYPFSPLFGRYLDRSPDAHKVAFFHDEHAFCGRRFEFLSAHRIDTVFTMLEPEQLDAVYGQNTSVSKLVSHLPGYVGEGLLDAAERFALPDSERPIDVGFRARPLEPYMGEDEKSEIARDFAERAAGAGLALDIEVGGESLLPGDEWYRFIASCKAMLGVESGTRCFDLRDEIYADYLRLAAERDEVSVEDLRAAGALERWTDRIYYRTIGPRHFEAAALRVCQVLFEGSYSGLMEPMRHYIPLKRDFSNFDEVLGRVRDPELRRELTENARRDLIDSGENSYARLIEKLDAVLAEAGLEPGAREGDAEAAARALHRSPPARALESMRSTLSYHPVLSRALWRVSRPVLGPWRRWRRARIARD